jgi:hypothetical protein
MGKSLTFYYSVLYANALLVFKFLGCLVEEKNSKIMKPSAHIQKE